MRLQARDTTREQFSRRLKFLADRIGGVGELARQTGISSPTLYGAVSAKSLCRVDTLAAIIRATGCSARWLLLGEGSPFSSDEGALVLEGYHTGGGNHWVVGDDTPTCEVMVPSDLIPFVVHGDSMDPVVRDGQVVLARPGIEPKDGDLAVVERESGEHTFKRVYFEDGGKTIILMPLNPSVRPERVRRAAIRRMMRIWGAVYSP